jgi:hypothetical protein
MEPTVLQRIYKTAATAFKPFKMKPATIKFIKLVTQSAASTTACEFNIHSYLKCLPPWPALATKQLLRFAAAEGFVHGVTPLAVRMHSNVTTAPQFKVT